MKTYNRFLLVTLLACALLPACGPSQAELYGTATSVAIDDLATQTAMAPTTTATLTPSPTLTPEPTATSTSTPTSSPTSTPIPTDQVENVTLAYQYLLIIDNIAGKIAETLDLRETGTLSSDQVVARIQTLHHAAGLLTPYLLENNPYQGAVTEAANELSSACRKWWSAEYDAQTFKQEMIAIQISLQPLLEGIHLGLASQGDADLSFEQTIVDDVTKIAELSDQIIEFDSSSDIFYMQRQHRGTLWASAPVLGEYTYGEGYSSPANTFQCNFAFSGIDGDLLYDFIFPDRTLVVFTNDFSVGQAVERLPIDEPIVNADEAHKIVEDLVTNSLLPTILQQHNDLRMVDQKWVQILGDPPQEAYQLILFIPKASFIYEITSTGSIQEDVVRGMWIFVNHDAVYIISYQDYPYIEQQVMTDKQLIEKMAVGLGEIHNTCTYR